MATNALAYKHFEKAFDYYFRGNRRAFKEVRTAIKHDPAWSRSHWLLGTLFMLMPPRDVESAIREFREVTRLEPRWSHGHYNLGKALVAQGRIDEALVPLREAVRLEPDAAWARVELAECLLKRDNYREAITVLRGKPFNTAVRV